MRIRNRRGHFLAAAAAVAVVAVGVSACGSSSSNNASSNNSSSNNTTAATKAPSGASSGLAAASLKMTTNGTIPGLDQVISAFEAKNPNVKISVTPIPSDNYQPTLRTELAANNGPDLMFVWGGSGNSMGIGQIASTNYLLPLGNPAWAQGLPGNVKSLYEANGKLYAAPINTYVSAFAYNKDAFASAGISGPPKTWSEFLSDCAKLKAKGIVPIEMGNQSGYLNMQIPAVLANDIAYSKNPNFGADVLNGKIDLKTSALWKNAVTTADKEYATLFQKGYIQSNSTATTLDQAIAAVASGKAAMTHTIPEFQQFATDNPKGHFGSFEVNASDTPGSVVVTEAPGDAFAINAHSHHTEAAQAFLNFLASPAQVDQLAKATQTFPLVKGATYSPGDIYANLVPLMQQEKIAQNPTNYFSSDKTKNTWVSECQALAAGSATAQQVTDAVLQTLS